VFAYVGVPDVPSWAGTCRAFAKVASEGDGEGWKAKWEAVREDLSGKHEEVVTVVDATKEVQSTQHLVQPPASSFAISDEDDFGDFSSHSLTKLALSEDDVVGIPSQPNDALDDGFGEFTGTTTGKSANGMTGSLLDLDFEEQDVPLPSSPTTARKSTTTGGAAGASSHHARRTSGFFGLSEKGLANLSKVASSVASTGGKPHGQTYLSLYKAHHLAMLPLCRMIRSNASASSSSHLLSSLSATLPTGDDASIGPTLEQQAALLTRLLRFLSGAVQPTRDWGWLRSTVVRGGVADRFEGLCLGVFEKAEERMARRRLVEPSAIRDAEDAGDVQRMKEAAMASWRVYSAANSGKDGDVSTRATKSGRNAEEARRAAKRKLAEEWELARVWIEKRELFYENNKWDSGANIV
jgi:recyclin-1